MPPASVQVTRVQPQTVPLVREATGRLSAFRTADVRARVGGVLLKRTYNEGTYVDEGQVLFKIDPAPFQATLNAAQAELAQAQATYANAKMHAERASKLVPKGYISKSEMDNALAAKRTAAAAVTAAKAQVDNARIKLGYATVRAPIAGRAGKQQVTEGALVGQGTATLLTTVRQIDPIYVTFSMPVGELQQLRAKQVSGQATLKGTSKASVTLKLPGGTTYPHTGTLDFAAASVDPATGGVTLRALVPNPEHVLLPGMYATLEVDMGSLNQAFLIPQNAVQRDTSSAYVLTVGKDNKVVRKNVTLDGMQGPNWVVTKGLAAGDRVIVGGIPKAHVGAVVKPVSGNAKPAGQKTAQGKTVVTPAAAASTPPAAAASSEAAGKPSTKS
ncbi:MAG TPA: efflux RND transporter periplasmic adaptor subunit [Oleiagrimonas sp.]|nr:efflux RND transporter periplasmic adaptor subunit [Oleiagrimonas sp.]